MESSRLLETCCALLESHKVTDRKQGCDDLTEWLRSKAAISILNENDGDRWDKLLSSIEACMVKDGEKVEGCKKKRSSTAFTSLRSVDLFVTFIRIAAKENAPLNFRKLFNFIVESLKNDTKKCYHHSHLNLLSHSFLTNSNIRSYLQSSDWEVLYQLLKSQCQRKSSSDHEIIKCLSLVMKWGPLCNFPVSVFREEFAFVMELCKEIGPSSPKPEQEAVLALVHEFCKHAAKDNRMTCCKLGEEILRNLVALYETNANEDKMKANLVEFFLLQVAIHHPNGVTENHPAAYAVSWTTWKNHLCGIYNLLNNEIKVSSERTIKNQAFFILKNGIMQLLDTFVFLFVEICSQLFDSDGGAALCDSEERPQKRPRMDIGFKNLTEKIKETRSWTWISLAYSFIESYPDMVGGGDYLDLLKTLTTLQVETKEASLAHHINEALLTMEKIECTINVAPFEAEVDQLWQTVTDATLRSMGINRNDEQIQTLLQRLIARKILNAHENLFQNYRPGGPLTVTKHNLKTVEVAFKQFSYLQYDNGLKTDVMQWILNTDSECFCDTYVARILVCLILKQWPHSGDQVGVRLQKPFRDVEDVYLSISFEKLLTCPEPSRNSEIVNVFCVDQRLFDVLANLLINLANKSGVTHNIEVLMNVTVLVFNVFSYLIEYGLVETDAACSLPLFENFEACATTLFANLHRNLNRIEERSLGRATAHAHALNALFSTNVSAFMSRKLRELVPQDLLKALFQGLKSEQEEIRRESESITFKKSLMQALATFACLPDSSLAVQRQVLEALLETDYDFNDDADYELVSTLIHSIRLCAPSLGGDSFLSIFNLVQGICAARYRCYMSAVKILELFYEIYPFVPDTEVCRSQFVQILYPFYCKRANYGPLVSVNLLNCMGLLYELEPDCKYSRWSNKEIVLEIPEFLTSDHQEVRFAAITNIAKFFRISSNTRLLEQFHRQEIMFSKIAERSLQVLRIECGDNPERIIDESVTRTASILHTFASVMITSYLWVGEALFTMLKIVCDKKIDLSQVNKVVEVLAKNLGFATGLQFLEKYVLVLFSRWKALDIEQFPFSMFECDNKIQFYAKYWGSLAAAIIELDRDSLNSVALRMGKSLEEVVRDICPKLLSYSIGQEIGDFNSLKNNRIYQLLTDTLSVTTLRDVFRNKIEEVYMNLIEFVSDATNFIKNFDENVVFRKTDEVCLTVRQFQECIRFVENSVFESTALMLFLARKHPEKIHHLLLHLNLKVDKARALEEKLRYFHLYSITILLCIRSIADEVTMQPYLIRTVTHSLLHFINSHKKQPELSQISCKFFKLVLQKILPDWSNVLRPFLLIIVSRLKNLALENLTISDMCVNMLQLLIVDHGVLFLGELEKLDSIPKTPKFENIYSVHHNIKYANRKVTLEDEIKQFLDFAHNMESFDECEHSLKHLRGLLSARKCELKSMYDRLRQTRGFSEDCQDSPLHQLICMLITLTSSINNNVSTEAVRCLGEIGPGDLNTLILQPERPLPNPKSTPWELVLACSLSLFSKYIVDGDVNVIEAASGALFQVFSTAEGRKVAESGSDYLKPFLSVAVKRSNFDVDVDRGRFMATIASDALWIPQNCSHATWITKLVCALLEAFQASDFFSSFIKVCKLKTEFCEQLLPLIIYMMLRLNVPEIADSIATKVRRFFAKHWEITIIDKRQDSDSITVDKSSVQCMLNVVHFIRLQRSIEAKKLIRDMNLDYLKVAKAAHFCTAHFTSLLYAELWCQERINSSPNDCNLSTCSSTKLDLVYDLTDEVTAEALYNILRKAYKAVGEVDALLGCGTSFLLSPQCRVEHYKETGKWQQVIHHYEMEISHGRGDALRPLVQSLNDANFYQLSLFCSDSLEEPHYESLWRLGQWDRSVRHDLSRGGCDKYKFYAFKALNDNDEFSFKRSLDKLRSCVVQNLSGINLESSKNFYDVLAQLQSFKEIEDFALATADGKLAELLDKWKIQDGLVQNDFQYIEPIKAQRNVLLTEFLKKNDRRDSLGEAIIDSILDFAEYARMEGSTNTASRALGGLQLLPNLSQDVIAKIRFEEAQLCWNLKNVIIAKGILRQLCGDENLNPRLHAQALKMTGKWMVESSSENRQTIIENYFQKSLDLLKKNVHRTAEDEKSMMDTFDQLAKFADREYQQVMTHIKSDIFQKKKENMTKAMQDVAEYKSQKAKKAARDVHKAMAIKERQSEIDRSEIDNIESEKDNLLESALRYYLLNLIKGDGHDISIFRLISLLLENRNSDVIKPVLETELIKIPTYKFVSILPQIVPHVSSATNDLFCQTVNSVIEKCAEEHPYHTLPLILALALSNRDQSYSESKAVVNDGRMQSAQHLLKRLKRRRNLASLISKMEDLSEALIELAYHKGSGNDDASFKMPKKGKIRAIQGFDDVLLPTYSLPVDKTGSYKRIVGIHSFGESYMNVGGINAPKRITCRGTDGINRTQLVKGQDDLRQDAVMQQVFTIMNSLLAVNKQTKNLLIRTYKIVPLSMRSGILEWVENTMPIGEYLTGKNGDSGAHVKYRPKDRTPKRCRVDFKNAGKHLDEKLKVFSTICRNIKPVFHKFFEDAFPQPTLWYERRRAYTHSVATSSMCGYILGIGDRHVNNILIDKSTAEVIHIDFGIAFEQGRVLPTPETVPFRLTRDMVDGMGVSGVEGVFRRSCEKTVEVLRLHYQTIITILEVLLYDPLYDWTVSSAEAKKRQKDEQYESEVQTLSVCGDEDSSEDVNATAERALLRLRAKLQGTEHGKLTTVEHQVGTLIQQAVDPLNLCRLFNGWQPYL